MLNKYHLRSLSSDGLIEGLGIKSLLAFFSAKTIRNGPRLLPQIAFCVIVLLILTRLIPSRFSGIAFGEGYNKRLKWKPKPSADDPILGGGLRLVVFGGGDIATPSKTPEKAGGEDASWTEVLCQKLDCTMHLSYMPRTDDYGGSVISNQLYDAALNRMATITSEGTNPGTDYSWLLENYPLPKELPDLQQQVDRFLATPKPQTSPRETLWVFSFGYWDIWKLAAYPRELALEMIEVQVRHIFSQIETLYQEARSDQSVAYSHFYSFLNGTAHPPTSGENNTIIVADVPKEPFRVFIPKLFDISLTPGFGSARFQPPYPHSKAEETRNGAYLTKKWNQEIDKMINEWLSIPDPTYNPTANETAGNERRDVFGNTIFVPFARREAIAYDASIYLQEMIVDRQLRKANITDHNGLGAGPTEKGFLEVWTPCMPSSNATSSACEAPHQYLFWTGFTVNQRAIDEIGKQAAETFVKHVLAGVSWLRKAQDKLPNLNLWMRPAKFTG